MGETVLVIRTEVVTKTELFLVPINQVGNFPTRTDLAIDGTRNMKPMGTETFRTVNFKVLEQGDARD